MIQYVLVKGYFTLDWCIVGLLPPLQVPGELEAVFQQAEVYGVGCGAYGFDFGMD